MTETTAPEPFVSNTKNRIIVEVVTIDGTEYTVDKNDVFVAMGEKHPELRPHVVAMFDRAGDDLATMRYPADIAKLPLDERTVPFVAGLLDQMPFDTAEQQLAADEAVKRVWASCDPKVRDIWSLSEATIARS